MRRNVFFGVLMSTLVFSAAWAEQHRPTWAFKKDDLELSATSSGGVLYRLYNQGRFSLWLDETHHGSAQAGFASQINPAHESALFYSGARLVVRCFEVTPQTKLKPLSCARNLRVVPVLQTNASAKINSGVYWVGENLAPLRLSGVIKARGFQDQVSVSP